MTCNDSMFITCEFAYKVDKFLQELMNKDMYTWEQEMKYKLTLKRAYIMLGINWQDITDIAYTHDNWPISSFIERYNALACSMKVEELKKHNAELEEAFQKASEEIGYEAGKLINDVKKKDEEKQQESEEEKLYKEKAILDKRCPFCNSYATITKIRKSYGKEGSCDNWYIKCKNCPAEMEIPADCFYGRVWYTYEQAKDMWNRRVT